MALNVVPVPTRVVVVPYMTSAPVVSKLGLAFASLISISAGLLGTTGATLSLVIVDVKSRLSASPNSVTESDFTWTDKVTVEILDEPGIVRTPLSRVIPASFDVASRENVSGSKSVVEFASEAFALGQIVDPFNAGVTL